MEQRAADEEMDRRGAAPGGAAAGASQEPGEEWGGHSVPGCRAVGWEVRRAPLIWCRAVARRQ